MKNDSTSINGHHSAGYLLLLTLTAALGGLLFGYDTAVISGAIGFIKSNFRLDDAQMGWAASCTLVGCVFGALTAGTICDRLGRKRGLQIAAVLFLASAVGAALAKSLSVFVIYRIIGGVGVGAASLISPLYIAEVSPARIRGRMVSVNQFAIVSGMLIVYFVNYIIAGLGGQQWNESTGWRWMFASGALPAAVMMLLLMFVPESPRWLLSKGKERNSEARDILVRIGGNEHANAELADIQQSVSIESASLSQLLEPGMRRVLLLGISLAVLQQITGINVFLYYAPEIFKSIVRGTGSDVALLQTVVVGAVNLLFTIAAVYTVDRLGRRPLMIIGSIGMLLTLWGMGAAAYFQRTEGWVLTFVLGYMACFALSLGPVVWVILSEIFPTKIRGRAMGIATICLWSANYIVSQTFPMMNGNAKLVAKFHHAFPFWLYGFFCIVMLVIVLRYVPETKGRSLEEIERILLPQRSEQPVRITEHVSKS